MKLEEETSMLAWVSQIGKQGNNNQTMDPILSAETYIPWQI